MVAICKIYNLEKSTSIWVFLKQIMLVGKCRLLKLLCNRLFYLYFNFFSNNRQITINQSLLYISKTVNCTNLKFWHIIINAIGFDGIGVMRTKDARVCDRSYLARVHFVVDFHAFSSPWH